MNQNTAIGFIGGGNMAQAIIRGLLAAGHRAATIHVADPDDAQRAALAGISPDIVVTPDNEPVAAACQVLVLAVKPQLMPRVVPALAAVARPESQVVLSIAAGVTLATLGTWLPGAKLVRVMPNTPALIGAGMSGLYAADDVTAGQQALASYIMEATGATLWVADEALIDAVTAVSGSGPAYFFLVIEAMHSVARELGFSDAEARLLTTHTAAGAGLLAAESPDSAATLREKVTSPGGTTAAALAQLEAGGIRDIFRSALIAARDRAVELGKDS